MDTQVDIDKTILRYLIKMYLWCFDMFKSDISSLTGGPPSQSALAVIGNIAFSLSKKKGKIINSPFSGDEFTRSPPVAQ